MVSFSTQCSKSLRCWFSIAQAFLRMLAQQLTSTTGGEAPGFAAEETKAVPRSATGVANNFYGCNFDKPGGLDRTRAADLWAASVAAVSRAVARSQGGAVASFAAGERCSATWGAVLRFAHCPHSHGLPSETSGVAQREASRRIFRREQQSPHEKWPART